ncbi:MAG: hypothetical protein GY715_20950 [Planctomycetes bacterium]|nr:hypothetical protein [Planctomycetota bacterium]
MTRSILFPILLAVLVTAGPTRSAPPETAPAEPPPPENVDRLVKLRLVSDVDRIEPGATFHLAVIFEIAEHWHTYWIDSGAGGAPTELAVRAPKGFTVGKTRFPRPRAFPGPEGPEYGYERETVLFVPVTAPKNLDDATAVFDVNVFFLACRDVCLLGDRDLRVEVPTVARRTGKTRRPTGRDGQRIETFQRRLPRPIARLDGGRASFDGKHLLVTGPAKAGTKLLVFPIQSPGIEYGEISTEVADGRFRLRAPVTVSPQNALGEPLVIGGVVSLGSRPDDPAYAWRIPVKTPASK